MEEINNYDSLFEELSKNRLICENKFIAISSDDFRKIIRTNITTAYKKPIEFHNCVFNIIYDDKSPQVSSDNELVFRSCLFETELKIENIVFTTEKLSFVDCQFNSNIEIIDICQGSSYHTNFLFEFSNCDFNYVIISFFRIRSNPNIPVCFNFSENIHENEFRFEDINQLEVSHFSNEELNKISFFRIESLKLNLSSVIGSFEIEETNLVFIRDDFQISNFVFDKSQILGSFVPEKSYEIQSIKSIKTEFKNIIDLTEYTVNELNFQDCVFEENFLIIKCKLSSIEFVNCSFEKTLKIVDFKGEIAKANFHRSILKKFLFFNGFDEETVNTTKECKIDFSYLFIQPTGHVIIRNVNKDNGFCGEIDFSYANILGTITLQDSQFKILNMQKSTIVGQFNKENVIVAEYSNRDTLVRIKNEFYKKNDKVKALEYKAKEFEKYLIEIDYPLIKIISKYISNFTNIKTKNIEAIVSIILLPFLLLMSILPFQYFTKTREYTLLFFNRMSNSFGISWARGVIFTIITAFIFYMSINCWGSDTKIFEFGWKSWSSFGEVWKGYLNILNIFNLNNQKIAIELNAFGETLFFLSKIFIAFGVYQTIAAFRKYGK